ncbi:MAG: hypothetical protein JWO43_470, partial [Candidatus Adlerbacteria bacterium]|nr:hypothetical protein [Candidatus Adlerbacteria bacterium]
QLGNWSWNTITKSDNRLGVNNKVTIADWLSGTLPGLNKAPNLTVYTDPKTNTAVSKVYSCNTGYGLQTYDDGSSMCVDTATGKEIQNPNCAYGYSLNDNNQCVNGGGQVVDASGKCPPSYVYVASGTGFSCRNPATGDTQDPVTDSTTAGDISRNGGGGCSASTFGDAFDPVDVAGMSCITKYENGSCNPAAPSGTDRMADGRSVSYGLFQVNISANGLQNVPECAAITGGRDCTRAFSGGAYTGSNHNTQVANQELYNTCVQAATNPSCNLAVANELLNTQGAGAWGTAAQNSCSNLFQDL